MSKAKTDAATKVAAEIEASVQTEAPAGPSLEDFRLALGNANEQIVQLRNMLENKNIELSKVQDQRQAMANRISKLTNEIIGLETEKMQMSRCIEMLSARGQQQH